MISIKNIGPGTVIAAAFIGPGTITMCSIAGAKYGLDLMWALLFSLLVTTILQLTAAKIGLITQKGLSSNLLDSFDNLVFKYLALVLVLSAILVGNTAYEAGNISGGVLGVSSIFGQLSYSYNGFIINLYSVLIGLLAFVPVIINAVFSKVNPIPAAAQPEYELSIEITTGISAPPIGIINKKPIKKDIASNIQNKLEDWVEQSK